MNPASASSEGQTNPAQMPLSTPDAAAPVAFGNPSFPEPPPMSPPFPASSSPSLAEQGIGVSTLPPEFTPQQIDPTSEAFSAAAQAGVTTSPEAASPPPVTAAFTVEPSPASQQPIAGEGMIAPPSDPVIENTIPAAMVPEPTLSEQPAPVVAETAPNEAVPSTPVLPPSGSVDTGSPIPEFPPVAVSGPQGEDGGIEQVAENPPVEQMPPDSTQSTAPQPPSLPSPEQITNNATQDVSGGAIGESTQGVSDGARRDDGVPISDLVAFTLAEATEKAKKESEARVQDEVNAVKQAFESPEGQLVKATLERYYAQRMNAQTPVPPSDDSPSNS